MDAKTLANQINGRSYGEEITPEECTIARDNNLLVVFGYSDDNTELRGFVHDEVGSYGSGSFSIDGDGLLDAWEDGETKDYGEAKEFFDRENNASIEINATWHDSGNVRWEFGVTSDGDTNPEFWIFEIKRDESEDEIFSKGIVVDCSCLLEPT